MSNHDNQIQPAGVFKLNHGQIVATTLPAGLTGEFEIYPAAAIRSLEAKLETLQAVNERSGEVAGDYRRQLRATQADLETAKESLVSAAGAATILEAKLEMIKDIPLFNKGEAEKYRGLYEAEQERRRLIEAQYARLCDEVYENDGETLKIVAERNAREAMTQSRDEWKYRYGQMDNARIAAEAKLREVEADYAGCKDTLKDERYCHGQTIASLKNAASEEIKAANGRLSKVEAALRELVACKDLKASFANCSNSLGAREREEEYNRRKPNAWIAARAALAPERTVAGQEDQFLYWLKQYTERTRFDTGDMAACWYASQRNTTERLGQKTVGKVLDDSAKACKGLTPEFNDAHSVSQMVFESAAPDSPLLPEWEPWERICDYIRGVNSQFIIVSASSDWPNAVENLDSIAALHNSPLLPGLERAAEICQGVHSACLAINRGTTSADPDHERFQYQANGADECGYTIRAEISCLKGEGRGSL